jgi:hypothetical protein
MDNILKPGVKYSWQEGSNFQITDKQFSSLFNNLNAIVQSPTFQERLEEAKGTIAIAQLQALMNEILGSAVQSGVATEVVDAAEVVN